MKKLQSDEPLKNLLLGKYENCKTRIFHSAELFECISEKHEAALCPNISFFGNMCFCKHANAGKLVMHKLG